MPLCRVYLSIEGTVEAESPADAVHDVHTLVKTQLDRIPRGVFEWNLKVLTGEMKREEAAQGKKT